MSTRLSFPSSLSPIDPDEVLGENAVNILAHSLDLIFDGRENEVSFVEVNQVLYLAGSCRRIPEVFDILKQKISDYLSRYSRDNLKSEDEPTSTAEASEGLAKAAGIFPLYYKIENSLELLFDIFNAFKRQEPISNFLRAEFLRTMNESNVFSSIIRNLTVLFRSLLTSNEREHVTQTEVFQSMLGSQSLLKFASPERAQELQTSLENTIEEVFREFLDEHPLKDPEDDDTSSMPFARSEIAAVDKSDLICEQIAEYAKQVLILEKTAEEMTEALLGPEQGEAVRDCIWSILSSHSNPNFKYALERVPLLMKKRKLNEFKLFLDSIEKQAMALNEVLLSVLKEIEQESTSLSKLPEILRFYISVKELFMCEKSMAAKIETHLENLVNRDNKRVLKELVAKIHEIALTESPNIMDLAQVLQYFCEKSKYILYHIQYCAKRLTLYREKQISKERAIMSQLSDISSNFELGDLGSLINQAAKSVELHIEDALFICQSAWPYKPPFPSPVSLKSISAEITTRYRKIQPNNILRFPINYWVVRVRDTRHMVNYMATGVQAEALVYLNTHRFASDSVLEPDIPSSFMEAALKSLVSRVPLLMVQSENVYVLNEDYKPDKIGGTIQLPTPRMTKEVDKAFDVVSQKNALLEAEIVRIMKSRIILRISELESQVRSALSNRCTVTEDEFRKRIEDVKARGYLEEIKNGKVKYLK